MTNTKSKLNQKADADFGRRAMLGVATYAVIWTIILISYDVAKLFPAFSFTFTLSIYTICTIRLYYTMNFETLYPQDPDKWRSVSGLGAVASAFAWGILLAFVVAHPELDSMIFITALTAAGMAAGGTSSLSSRKTVVRAFLICLLTPYAGTVIILGIEEHYIDVLLILVFTAYLLGIANKQHQEYWSALFNGVLLEKQAIKLEKLNNTDPLTQIGNRRFFDETIEKEWQRSLRNQTPLSLLLVDLDHFKSINDKYGHQCGDHCLRTVALILEDELKRATDTAARYGGEEFAIIMPDTCEKNAFRVAENIRARIEREPVIFNGQEINLTTSAGVTSCIAGKTTNTDQLFCAADNALYQAKDMGRNQVQRGKIKLLSSNHAGGATNRITS